MLPEEIIIAPVVTEKSNDQLQEGKYTFKVNKKATKVEIAKAVEKLFEVKVLNVNTINVRGKKKRVGYHVGKTSDWKKAIVTIDTNPSDETYLTKGGKEVKVSKKYKDSIDEFMGVHKTNENQHLASLNFIRERTLIKLSGKTPDNKEYLLCGAGKTSVNNVK